MDVFDNKLDAHQILTVMVESVKIVNVNLFADKHRTVQLEKNASIMLVQFLARLTPTVVKIRRALMVLACLGVEITRIAGAVKLVLTTNAQTLVKTLQYVDQMQFAIVRTI
jgi:hypothetical protein